MYDHIRFLPDGAALWRIQEPTESKTKVDEVKAVLAEVDIPVNIG